MLAVRIAFRSWPMRLLQLAAALVVVSLPQGSGAQSPAPPMEYDVKCRFLIVHTEINRDAQPVHVDTAARAHAARIASPKFAEFASKKFRLNELPTLHDAPAGDVAGTLIGAISVVGRPSKEATNITVVELRAHSTSANDALTIARAFQVAYEDFLELPETDIEASIEQAAQARDQWTDRCKELRRPGKSVELAEAERLLEETTTELSILKLKARVGKFAIVTVDSPDAALAVEAQ